MKIILSGCLGHMGQEVVKLCESGYCDVSILYGIDAALNLSAPPSLPFPVYSTYQLMGSSADCVVDFSHHSATRELLDFCIAQHLPLVLATTGQTDEEKAMIKEASAKIPLFFAANYSLGIALLIDMAKKAASAMPDSNIEIVEKHHNRKLDAPSGTALAIAGAICEVRPAAYTHCGRSGMGKREPEEIGIHALRMGNIVGEHEVILATPSQSITIKHEAYSRSLFAEGALQAVRYLVGRSAGLYSMEDMLADE